MTRKEFLTNLIRDLGYRILEVCPEGHRTIIFFEDQNRVKRPVTVWCDKGVNASVKLKDCPLLNAEKDSYKAEEITRRIRVWLAERGFEAVVDWCTYRKTGRGPVPENMGYPRIRAIDYPWHQAARALTKEEALEDGLTRNKRFKAVGNILG